MAVILAGSWITHTTTADITLQHEDLAPASIMLEYQADKLGEGNSMVTQNGGLSPLSVAPTDIAPLGLTSGEIIATEEPSSPLQFETHIVKRGDTLGRIFKQAGLDMGLPHALAAHEVGKQLVKLSVGAEMQFGYDQHGALKELHYPINSLESLTVTFAEDKIVSADVIELPYQTIQKVVSGEITSSLYQAALDAGLSIDLVMEMVRIFGWDVDFVMDIHAGDHFHVVYEEFRHNGKRLANGGVVAAEFNTQNETYRAIRYTNAEGETSFYNADGESMLGTFLRSPVEFSRISSRFGKRKHPILKRWRKHNGVDYAAKRGTPIRATADGKVIHAGNKGGYGRTVILRHAGRFSTLYAHMSGFAKGIRNGTRVKQGEVIGYIGSSGLATGPHLHYEFRLDGVHRNPLTFKTPKASAVAEPEMPVFESIAQQRLAQLDTLSKQFQLARLTASE